MKKISIVVFLIFLIFPAFSQSPLTPYHDYAQFLLAPPGEMDIGLYGFINPAVLSYLRSLDALVVFSNPAEDFSSIDRWGLFLAIPGLGFGVMNSLDINDSWTTKYRISNSFGSSLFSLGFGYEWSETSSGIFDPDDLLITGFLVRPIPYLSIGLSGSTTFSGEYYETVFEAGVRPLKNDGITIFSDYALLNAQDMDDLLDGTVSVGLVVKFPFCEGLYCAGRFYPQSLDFSIGVKLSAGYTGVTVQPHFNPDTGFTHLNCGIRAGSSESNCIESLVTEGKYYMKLELNSPITYQGFSFFKKPITMISLLKDIEAAKHDPSVAGIVVNTSGIVADSEQLWEIRQMLLDFKATGKQVVVFMDHGSIDLYHLASVSDRIVIDPLGRIMLQGYLAGLSFYKGSLEKLGIGFEELRLYTHKSALEALSRESMSEASREQLAAYISDIYNYTKTEICNARRISEDDFETYLNTITLFNAEKALSHKLVDEVGRWEKVEEVIENLEGKKMVLITPDLMQSYHRPYNRQWGEEKKIALIYAVGICAMDAGIKARSLQHDIDAAAGDPAIKAVVIRVDSPGGDALASDLVAEAITRCKKEKPVIISQGIVAASGGYWLSMNGDVICAGPQTMTGSIGVAAGWMYDNGIKEKLGISTDFVKKGEHADFGFGFSLPFILIGLPDRNLNDDERYMLEDTMRSMYKMFVDKVAAARDKGVDAIEAVAQGRVWSGIKAKEIGLVDEIGGLSKAVAIAKERVGIPPDEEIKIVELPAINLFQLYSSFLSFIGITSEHKKRVDTPFDVISSSDVRGSFDHLFQYLQLRVENNGKAMPIIDFNMMDILRGR